MSLDEGLAGFLKMLALAPAVHETTPAAARQSMRAMTVNLVTEATRISVGNVDDLDVAGRPGRIYRPAGAGPWPTLVFLHGGGFVLGDLDTHDQTCRLLCAGAGIVVLSLDYRLAPEFPFPAAVEDTLAAVDWAHRHLVELGGTRVLAVGGDSAGGNLAAVAAQARPDALAAQVLIYPATDPFGEYESRLTNAHGYYLDEPTLAWFIRHYLSSHPVDSHRPDDVRHSPVLAAPDVLARTPPALVVTAEFDPLRDEGEAYAVALRAAGVAVELRRYDGMIHGFLGMGATGPRAAAAVTDVIARTRTLLHR